jgi:probable F420-dependent oxidoreductase
MTEVAGEVCDGFLCHPFTTDQYIKEVTMPALEAGFAKGDRSRDDYEISGTAFVVTGRTEEDMASTAQAVKMQMGFYGSTPAYKGVLELAGYDGLQPELNALSKQGNWAEMANLIDDDLLHLMAVVAEPDDVADALRKRWNGSVDRLSFYASFAADPELWGPVIEALKA